MRILFENFGWDFNSYNKFVFVCNFWVRLVFFYEYIMCNFKNKMDFMFWLYSIFVNGNGGGGDDW